MCVCVITWRVHVYLYISSVCVYILSLNAVNEKVMIGPQMSRQQVGKKSVGQQPGMLGLMRLWANRCPSRATVSKNIPLSEEKRVKESEKRSREVIKNTHGSMWWQCVSHWKYTFTSVECQEEWGHRVVIQLCVKYMFHTEIQCIWWMWSYSSSR